MLPSSPPTTMATLIRVLYPQWGQNISVVFVVILYEQRETMNHHKSSHSLGGSMQLSVWHLLAACLALQGIGLKLFYPHPLHRNDSQTHLQHHILNKKPRVGSTIIKGSAPSQSHIMQYVAKSRMHTLIKCPSLCKHPLPSYAYVLQHAQFYNMQLFFTCIAKSVVIQPTATPLGCSSRTPPISTQTS